MLASTRAQLRGVGFWSWSLFYRVESFVFNFDPRRQVCMAWNLLFSVGVENIRFQPIKKGPTSKPNSSNSGKHQGQPSFTVVYQTLWWNWCFQTRVASTRRMNSSPTYFICVLLFVSWSVGFGWRVQSLMLVWKLQSSSSKEENVDSAPSGGVYI